MHLASKSDAVSSWDSPFISEYVTVTETGRLTHTLISGRDRHPSPTAFCSSDEDRIFGFNIVSENSDPSGIGTDNTIIRSGTPIWIAEIPIPVVEDNVSDNIFSNAEENTSCEPISALFRLKIGFGNFMMFITAIFFVSVLTMPLLLSRQMFRSSVPD